MSFRSIFYVWWPEGQPEDAVAHTSWWKHSWSFAKRHLWYGFHITKAKRIRTAISREGPPNPELLEYALYANNLSTSAKKDWPESYRPDLTRWVELEEFTTHSVV